MHLYQMWDDAEKLFHNDPFIAVFKKDNKTLVYLGDAHSRNVSFDMSDFCFSNKMPKPEIAVLELNPESKLSNWSFHDNTLAYLAAIATQQNIPVVYADLSNDEKLKVLETYNPNQNFKQEDLKKIFSCGGPSYKKGQLNKFAADIDKYGRDPFMIENITAALNKYDTIFASMGTGHYYSQVLILEDMLGKPEYLDEAPNTRGDFSNIEIKSIKLI